MQIRSGSSAALVVHLGAAVLLAGCGGDPVNPVGANSANKAPEVRSMVVDPATISPGGSATLLVNVTDPDGNPTLCRYQADHGSLVMKDTSASCNGAKYVNDGGSEASDTLQVTVTDSNNVAATSSTMIAIARPSSTAASPNPSPSPTAAPPSPSPTPPSPPPPQNHPPQVTVAGGGQSCHPNCSVTLTAQASDPDRDRLSYSWSGCASGSGTSAQCTVTGLQSYSASVTVSDGRGGEAHASASASGVNMTPAVTCPDQVTVTGQQQVTGYFSLSDDDANDNCWAEVDAPASIASVDCLQVTVNTCDPSAGACYGVVYIHASDPFRATGTCKWLIWAR